jgi:hypothetical protein
MVKEIHTETSSLRTLKTMPRNLIEIVQYVHEFGFRSLPYYKCIEAKK